MYENVWFTSNFLIYTDVATPYILYISLWWTQPHKAVLLRHPSVTMKSSIRHAAFPTKNAKNICKNVPWYLWNPSRPTYESHVITVPWKSLHFRITLTGGEILNSIVPWSQRRGETRRRTPWHLDEHRKWQSSLAQQTLAGRLSQVGRSKSPILKKGHFFKNRPWATFVWWGLIFSRGSDFPTWDPGI